MRWCLSWRSKTGRQSRRRSAAYGTHRCAAIAVQGALLCLALLQHAVASPSFDVRAAERVLQRLLPHYASQFDLGAIERRDGREMCRISGSHGRVRVEGSTPSALLFGVNWYLKYVAHVQISTNGDQLGTAGSTTHHSHTGAHTHRAPTHYWRCLSFVQDCKRADDFIRADCT